MGMEWQLAQPPYIVKAGNFDHRNWVNPYPATIWKLVLAKEMKPLSQRFLGWTNDPTQINLWGKRKEQLYRRLGKKKGITLLPGVKEFLEQAKKESFRFCVVTSTEKRMFFLP